MTNWKRAGAAVFLWLGFAVCTATMFMASLGHFESPMKALAFLNIVILLGTLVSVVTARHL